jgi:ribosomal protein L32
VIWLRPTQSLTAWLQGNGRGLRIAPGKRDLLILDHVGNCGRLGHPLEVHEWSLEGRRKRDREAAPSVKVCPKCFATTMSTAQICRECGHVFAPQEARELKVVDGELVELQTGNIKVGDYVTVSDRRIASSYPGSWRVHTIDHIVNSYAFITKIKTGDPGGDGHWLKISRLRLDSKAAKREQGNAQSLQDLIALGHQRGYKNPTAWAKHVLAGRQRRSA